MTSFSSHVTGKVTQRYGRACGRHHESHCQSSFWWPLIIRLRLCIILEPCLWRHLKTLNSDNVVLCLSKNCQWFPLQMFPNLEQPPEEHFVTFPIDTRVYQRPLTSHGNKQVKVMLQPITNLQDVQSCLKAHVTRYNEEFGNVPMDIMLSDYIIGHIIKMHRILSFHHGWVRY